MYMNVYCLFRGYIKLFTLHDKMIVYITENKELSIVLGH